MTILLLFILPGAFHGPASYDKLIEAFTAYKQINKCRVIIKCIDYQRIQYITQHKMITMTTYIDESIKSIKNEYTKYRKYGDKCLVYLIGHSMGSRLSQMVVHNLIKYEQFSIHDIGGLIHIAGTVLKNGQTYKELSDKHYEIVKKPTFKQENNIIQFGCINKDECWMRINTIEFVKYYFLK
eukprot:UN11895